MQPLARIGFPITVPLQTASLARAAPGRIQTNSANHTVQVTARAGAPEYVYVCVCERETMCVRAHVCVCVCERGREGERVYVCVRPHMCVCVLYPLKSA